MVHQTVLHYSLLYLRRVMKSIIKSILFLSLVFVLHAMVGDVLAKENLCKERAVVSYSSVQSYFDNTQLPHSLDAELGSIGFYLQQTGTDRPSRTPWEPVYSLRNIGRIVAERYSMLFKYESRLDDSFFSSLTSIIHPVSDYYVFALRHIII